MITISPVRRVIATLLVAFAAGTAAVAEVQVSITITGTAEELVPILQLLEDAGIAQGPGPDIEVHSVFEETPAEPAQETQQPPMDEAASPEPVDEQTLQFGQPKLEPSAVAPGGQSTLTVALQDPEKRVDTVAATVGEATGLSFDLYDNGTHGDAKAGDGTWTYVIHVPAGMAPGDQAVQLVAFDAYGDPVTTGPDNTPLVAQTTLSVKSE